MNRQTALSNALACFHYLLSMYPDSLIDFTQWSFEYGVSMHVDLSRYDSERIVSDLDDIRLSGSTVNVSTNLRPLKDVIRLTWEYD